MESVNFTSSAQANSKEINGSVILFGNFGTICNILGYIYHNEQLAELNIWHIVHYTVLYIRSMSFYNFNALAYNSLMTTSRIQLGCKILLRRIEYPSRLSRYRFPHFHSIISYLWLYLTTGHYIIRPDIAWLGISGIQIIQNMVYRTFEYIGYLEFRAPDIYIQHQDFWNQDIQ